MAEANIKFSVELVPSETTASWLESLGWIRPGAPSSESVSTEVDADDEDDWDPAEMLDTESGGTMLETFVDAEPEVGIAQIVESPDQTRSLLLGGMYPGLAMNGAQAMRHRAAVLRRGLMSEVSSPERVDELLRMCDVDPTRLPDCDC